MRILLVIIIYFILYYNSTLNKQVENCKKPIKTYTLVNNKICISQYIDIPYVYGGTSKKGIDCSGLTQMIYKEQFDTLIPRTSYNQVKVGQNVSIDSLKRGDLLFFKNNTKVSHVAMYLDNNLIIQATSRGVIIDSIGSTVWNVYWKQRFSCVKRIL